MTARDAGEELVQSLNCQTTTMYVIGISLLVVFAPIAVVFIIGRMAGWIVGPVELAGELRRENLQFTLADILSLILLVQIPMAAIETLIPGDAARMTAHAISALACTAVWWFGVGKLSTAGVRKPWHRVLYLVVVSPLAYFGSIIWLIVWCMLMAGIYEFLAGQTKLPLVGLTAANLTLSAAFYGAARLSRRIAAEVRLEEDDNYPSVGH